MIPPWDQTGTPLHFHSSTTSGSACLIRERSRESVSPRQSPSSSILASISSAGDSAFERLFMSSPRLPDPCLTRDWATCSGIERSAQAHERPPAQAAGRLPAASRHDRQTNRARGSGARLARRWPEGCSDHRRDAFHACAHRRGAARCRRRRVRLPLDDGGGVRGPRLARRHSAGTDPAASAMMPGGPTIVRTTWAPLLR